MSSRQPVFYWAVAALMLLCSAAFAAPLQVRIQGSVPPAYFPRLLRLTLEKTVNTDGPFEITEINQSFSSLRLATELRENGAVNVIWDSTNEQREKELLPVRISLLRRLNDYRAFLIRPEDRAKFAQIRSLDELRKFKAGGGVNWPSTDVLRANGLPVVTTYVYESLCPMLMVKRFDYLPRGMYAVQLEQHRNAHLGVVVEQTLMLHYPAPFYFFVNRSNPALADRLERGLRIALKDGSFDKLFNSIDAFRDADAEIRSGKRRVLELRRDGAFPRY